MISSRSEKLIPRHLVETPAAVVDLSRARANAEKVVRYLSDHGLAWRPHVKTHKSRVLARIQLEAGARGLTVATLREAEAMAPLGADLLLAHPPVGEARRVRLTQVLARTPLSVALDSPEALDTVRAAANAAQRAVPVLVEIDVGMGRVGLTETAEVLKLAEAAASSKLTSFRGILFYPGHIRKSGAEQDVELEALRDRLSRVLADLRSAGLPPEVVSGGSTPTLWRSHDIPGVTEIRAGTCIFHDRDTLALGVCDPSEVAYRVETTVVSTAVPGQAVVDAGSKALAREEFRADGRGYGIVLEHPEVPLSRLSEEHGVLDLSGTEWRPRVGDRVSVIPNHVCVSVNLQDQLLAEEPGDQGGQPLRVIPLEGRGRTPLPDQ